MSERGKAIPYIKGKLYNSIVVASTVSSVVVLDSKENTGEGEMAVVRTGFQIPTPWDIAVNPMLHQRGRIKAKWTSEAHWPCSINSKLSWNLYASGSMWVSVWECKGDKQSKKDFQHWPSTATWLCTRMYRWTCAHTTYKPVHKSMNHTWHTHAYTSDL